jgi:hypothetical protein
MTNRRKPRRARNERPLTPRGEKAQHHLYPVVEVQEMIVAYMPDWMVDMGHFEFRSPHEPPRRARLAMYKYPRWIDFVTGAFRTWRRALGIYSIMKVMRT